MTNKEVIIKAVDYIEDNLKNDINVFQVSQEVCYSLYHFIRLFQSITGFSPGNYLLQRRLTESVHELQATDKKITDIAFDYQFGSPESFSRAFRRHFGMNPTEVRNGHSLTSLPLIQRVTREFLSHVDSVRRIPPELVELPETILVGISFFIPDDSSLTNLTKEWTRFLNEAGTVNHKLMPERYYQVQYWSANQELGGMYFFTGVEVSKVTELNPLFVVKNIPSGRYLKFLHKGYSNQVGYTYKYIYTQYLPETDFRLNRPFNFEYYGELYKGPCDENSESWIFIPVEL